MNNLADITKNLSLHDKGFWEAADTGDSISYPDDGNELCAEIEDHSFWFRHRNNVITTAIRNFPPSGAVFDIGGGNGFVAKGLTEAGFDCILIEPGRSGAVKAVERGVENVICATVESVGLETHSIPSIGLFDVIEHIEDDVSFLKNLHSLVEPGGRLYATVPAYNFLWSNEDKAAGHFRRHTIKSISNVLKKAGFQVEYATYFFSFLPPGVFLLRSLPTLLGKKQAASAQSTKKMHQAEKTVGSGAVDKILNFELGQIKAKKRIPFGGSCFVVAKG